MIEIRYQGQLGNRLFQYAVGRILAEHLGLKLHAEPIPPFAETFIPVEGESYPDLRPAVFTGHELDIEAVISARPRHIVLEGYFQNFSRLLPFRDLISKWFCLPDSHLSVEPGTLLVMVRAKDFCELGLSVDHLYYERLIPRVSFNRLLVTSDDVRGPILAQMKGLFDGSILELGILETFQLAKKCERLIIPNSTFAWWCAFLSEASEIHVPIPNSYDYGCWGMGRFQDSLDLRVDEARFRYHYNVPIGYDPMASDREISRRWKLSSVAEDQLKFHQRSQAFRWEVEKPSGLSMAAVMVLDSAFSELKSFALQLSGSFDDVFVVIREDLPIEIAVLERLQRDGLSIHVRRVCKRDLISSREAAEREAAFLVDSDFIFRISPGQSIGRRSDLISLCLSIPGGKFGKATSSHLQGYQESFLIFPRELVLRRKRTPELTTAKENEVSLSGNQVERLPVKVPASLFGRLSGVFSRSGRKSSLGAYKTE